VPGKSLIAFVSKLVLLAFFCFTLTSCSAVSGALEKVGKGDLKEKLDTAWSEVGKEKIDNLIDDVWREYGFGKSLNWPEDGNGVFIPKFRDGKVDYCFVSSGGDCGIIKISGVKEEEYKKYLLSLVDLGYKQTLAKTEFNTVYVFDGLYLGFILEKDENVLFLGYGGSVSQLDDTLSNK